ncbi:MAG TPA: pyridoxamine 5'-phosphate oxidase family protein [Cytophagales bacterium]|nr:pyridoxamine 5'-phosphate oxidase family protein [Cytophagales bacterium]
METITHRQEALETLYNKIKDVRFCMLTTAEPDGTLRSRPMATVKSEPNGTLWFFTKESTGKVDEINHYRSVNLSYADPGGNVYVSVSGEAIISFDKTKMEALWNPLFRAWFPQGIEDPEIALVSVNIKQAEYWEASSNKMVQLFGMVKAMVTGSEYQPGDHEKFDF